MYLFIFLAYYIVFFLSIKKMHLKKNGPKQFFPRKTEHAQINICLKGMCKVFMFLNVQSVGVEHDTI